MVVPRWGLRLGAELLALEGGGHVATFAHRAEAKARVTRFLREHAPAAR